MNEYDPTQALGTIRDGMQRAKTWTTAPAYVRSALENFGTLDEWMAAGGRPPADWRPRRRGRPALTKDGTILTTLKVSQHGTRYGYNHGCHCLPCRAANRGEDPAVIQEMKRERGWA